MHAQQAGPGGQASEQAFLRVRLFLHQRKNVVFNLAGGGRARCGLAGAAMRLDESAAYENWLSFDSGGHQCHSRAQGMQSIYSHNLRPNDSFVSLTKEKGGWETSFLLCCASHKEIHNSLHGNDKLRRTKTGITTRFWAISGCCVFRGNNPGNGEKF